MTNELTHETRPATGRSGNASRRTSARSPTSTRRIAPWSKLASNHAPQAITTVYSAIHAGNPDAPLLAILQLDTLSKFATADSNNTVLVPYESAALLGAAQALRSLISSAPGGDAPPSSK